MKYFLASELDHEEISLLLSRGWRKFGIYYFIPECVDCHGCIPVRIPVRDFSPSKSQKRVLKKNSSTRVSFGPINYSDRAYDIYRLHSKERFGTESEPADFVQGFYQPSCPSLQSEYYAGGELAAIGYLDKGSDCLSSVYFIFDPSCSDMSLGTLSIIREIEYACELGLEYYYLGYYVPGCSRMAYKGQFYPREFFDWEKGIWARG